MTDESILIVKTGEPPASVERVHGDFEDWIARGLGLARGAVAVAPVHLGASLPGPSSFRGVVVTGSPAMVSERAEWSESAARWLAQIVRDDAIPVLGICYGHQLLAHGLGGVVGPNPKGREMGTVEVTFRDDSASDRPRGFGTIFEEGVLPGHMSHVESVLRPPDGARVLAQTALDPHSVLEFGPRQWGVQAHPEFDRAIMRGYIEARRAALVEEGLDPATMIEDAVETPELTGVLARFAATLT